MHPKFIYQGPDRPADAGAIREWLASPPPWRRHDPAGRGESYVSAGEEEVEHVNVALLLRRPLLVKGKAGVGKSTLAHGIARALGLGPPLVWPINSQTTLRDGLYGYDAVSHFQAIRAGGEVTAADFITLGPLGTALLPGPQPRVLLVDELDKASYDLPNDLLHVFEEGEYRIEELARSGGKATVRGCDDTRAEITGGHLVAEHHPVVVITENGERTFPDAFLRRCVVYEMKAFDRERLDVLIARQLPGVGADVRAAVLDVVIGQPNDVALQSALLHQNGYALDLIQRILVRPA